MLLAGVISSFESKVGSRLSSRSESRVVTEKWIMSRTARRDAMLAAGPRGGGTMPSVTCPSCGEKGKIGANLIGARIKCKKCGNSFLVAAPVAKAPATAGLAATQPAGAPHGIEVEGLDASSWSLSTEPVAVSAVATVDSDSRADAPAAFVAAGPESPRAREYKILTSRDKYFDGKFDLARLEEALNHFAKMGWAVKAVSTPHVKGFTGAMEETITVLMER
jgi:Domain of unknown function (DUF4177)